MGIKGRDKSRAVRGVKWSLTSSESGELHLPCGAICTRERQAFQNDKYNGDRVFFFRGCGGRADECVFFSLFSFWFLSVLIFIYIFFSSIVHLPLFVSSFGCLAVWLCFTVCLSLSLSHILSHLLQFSLSRSISPLHLSLSLCRFLNLLSLSLLPSFLLPQPLLLFLPSSIFSTSPSLLSLST